MAVPDLSQIPISGSPNIAVEIISPCERTAESTRKVWVYLRADVEEVWQSIQDPGRFPSTGGLVSVMPMTM